MTDYDMIIIAIKDDIDKQRQNAVNPSDRILIAGEMRALEIIDKLKGMKKGNDA